MTPRVHHLIDFAGQAGLVTRGSRSPGLHITGALVDAANFDQTARIGKEVLDPLGQVDILVNKPGTTWVCAAEDYPFEAGHKVTNLSVRSVFRNQST